MLFSEPVSKLAEDRSDGKDGVTENGTVKTVDAENDASNIITTTAEITPLQSDTAGLIITYQLKAWI